ncbi:MAG: ABC transporter ATP-binding protein [Dehalococcoidales bacterium]|jgi:ABC-2 type transport system ATP-binding protein
MHSIYVQDLKKSYGTQKVLDGVNLVIEEGEFYALMGPNGSGKTTLSSIIASVTTFDSGVVQICGKKPEQARKMIAYIPQENFSVPQLSGKENLVYFASILGISGRDAVGLINSMLEKVGLTKDADKQFSYYSGGMKKRLELATALFPGVRVLILDEPTTGLDPTARRDFFTLLRDIIQDRTSIFLITHLGIDAESASKVGFIHKGKIIAEGTPTTLRTQYAPEETITIETPTQSSSCEAIIKTFNEGQKVAQLQNGYRIYAHDAGQVLPEIIKALNQAGIAVNRTEVAKPSLEDVFFKLTEQPMREV